MIAGSPDRRIAGSPDRRIAGSPDRRIAGSPDRRIAKAISIPAWLRCRRTNSSPARPEPSAHARRSSAQTRPDSSGSLSSVSAPGHRFACEVNPAAGTVLNKSQAVLAADTGATFKAGHDCRKRPYAPLLVALMALCISFSTAKEASASIPSSTIYKLDATITPSDPSACTVAVANPSRGIRKMAKERTPAFGTDVNAWLFKSTCDGGVNTFDIELHEDYTETVAASEAKKYGEAIGRLPKVLRAGISPSPGIKKIQITPGKNNWFADTSSGTIYIYTKDRSNRWLEEVLAHEAAHTSLDKRVAGSSEWLAARNADRGFISLYGQRNPWSEDVAESFLAYFQARFVPSRIGLDWEETIFRVMPNRIAYFDALLSANGMLPFIKVKPRKVGLILNDNGMILKPSTASSYSIRLLSPPSATVTVTPVSSEETVAKASGPLSFTTRNWHIPQTVTVTTATSGKASISHTLASSDSNYTIAGSSLPSMDVDVTTDGPIELTVSASPADVIEGGTKTITLTLNRPLVAGEEIKVPLHITDGNGEARHATSRHGWADYLLTCENPLPTGVTCPDLNRHLNGLTVTFTFTGPSATSLDLTLSAHVKNSSNDDVDEVHLDFRDPGGGVTFIDRVSRFNIRGANSAPAAVLSVGVGNPSDERSDRIFVTEGAKATATVSLSNALSSSSCFRMTRVTDFTFDNWSKQVEDYTFGSPIIRYYYNSTAIWQYHAEICIPAGKTEGSTVISIVDDTDVEDIELLRLRLSSFHYSVGDGTALDIDESKIVQLTINDNDSDTTRPEVSIAAQAASATEGGNAVFTVTASPAPATNLTVSLAVTDDGSSDFLDLGDEGKKTVTIAANQTSAELTIPTQDDSFDEADGSITAIVQQDSGYIPSETNGSSSVAISDNDDPPPIEVSIAAKLATTTEGDDAVFTISADAAPTVDIKVTLSVADDTTSDFLDSNDEGNQTVTITANQTSTELTVSTQDDSTLESDGSVTATVQAGSGYTVADTNGSASVAISDNDSPTLSVTISPTSSSEGNTGNTYATVTFNLDPVRSESTSFKACLNNTGTATRGASADYQFVNSGNDTPLTLTNDCHNYTLAANAASGSARLLVRGDGNFESDETVVVELKDPPTGVVVSQTAGTATHVIVNDDAVPTACVSETLLQKVEDYYDHNKSKPPGYGYSWYRVLVAFGARSPSAWTADSRATTPMTAAEAQQREQNWFGWTPIADALECLEGGTIDPEITISGANAITEGGSATFTLTASPAPQSTITVNVDVVDSGNFADSDQAGSRQVAIGTDGSGTLTVSTDNDSTDEPDGTLTATVTDGTGYTLGTTSSSALDVTDNDATTVTLVGTADKVTEGSTKVLTVTLGRGLVQGETLTVPLTFAGTATRNTDYTLSESAATGVTYTNLNSGTASVKFTGPNSGTTASIATITFNATTDSIAESPEETVDIGLGTLAQTGLSGDTSTTDNLASFNIADPAPLPAITVTNGAAVTEGTAASFTLSATPNPSASLTVNLNVTQSGQFAANADLGAQTVAVGTSGTATYTVDTVGDQVNEADGSVTVTVGSGTGYMVGDPSAASVAVSDDDIAPSTCVSDTLLQTVEDYYDHNKDSSPGYGHNWFRVLVAFGARSPSAWTADNRATTPMTATEATEQEQIWYGWGPVAEALECLEGTNPDPVITISGANTVTEGGSATFTLTATPAPSSSITVTLPTLTFSSGYSGSVAGSSITVPSGQSTVNFDVNVDNDSVDRPDGTLSVALQTGTGYTVGTPSSHALDVADNDVTTVTLAGTTDKVTEGSTKAVTVTLGRGLVQGETLTVPLTFAGTATRNTDYTLSESLATGVTYSNLNSGTASVKFNGPNSGTTASVATITFNATADSTSESPEETVDIGLGTPVQTGLSGGTTKHDNLLSFNIADPAALPAITVTGSAAVTEGTAASFIVTATPNPSASLNVNLNVTQSGQFVASADRGTKTVTVGTSGTATYTVDTVGDQVNEADGSVTVTVGSGTGYTVGTPSAASVAVSDDDITPSTCVSQTLLQTVEDYYDHNKSKPPGYGHNWFRVLVAFGARSPSAWTADSRATTPMTAAEATEQEQIWYGWGPVAEALECLEGANHDPVITISGANAITEGGSATFTLTASPTPQSQLTVNVNVVDSGNFADSGQAGTRTVTVGTGGSGTLTVSTDNDHTDEPDGTLTATVTDGTGYTLGTTSSSALDVTDNDATTVTLAGSAGKVTEGSSKTFTLTLSRGLIQGETLTAPLTFAGTATRNTDYTLSGTAATGVTYTSLNSGTARIKFTGPNLGTTATVATVTFNATTDSIAESPEETVDIGLGTPVQTGLSGGISTTNNLASFNIADPAALPAITVTGGTAVTEGTAASFVVTATPTPSASLNINLNVTQTGQFVVSSDRGTKTVTVGTSGSASYTVDTVGDQVYEADGSVTVTVGSGNGYTVGSPSAASVTVNDDDIAPSTCVSDPLVEKVEDYYDHNKDSAPGYGYNWFRVLIAFGERSASGWAADDRAITPMTTAEAQQREQNWFGWGPVAEALECLDEVGPDPEITTPVVSISGGDAITEGGTASFTLTANPTPPSTITVNVNVVDSDSFADSGQTGTRTVSIGTDGTATLTVTTDDDSTDEPDGTLTATVTSGTGYTPSGTNAGASITVNDNDDPPPATPVVSISGGNAITEGGSASFTLTANPVPQSQITVNVNVADSGSFSDSGQAGTRTVSIGTDGTATLTVATDDDSIDEPDGTLTATVQSGQGYVVSNTNASFSITVNDNDDPPVATPKVSITAGAKVTEGTASVFTVTATPSPTAPLDVTLTIGQSGDFAASGETGSRTVTVPISGSVTFDVATVDDGADEPDGSITATVDTGTGYTVAAPPDNAATVAVSDNDAPASGPTLSIADATFNEKDRIVYFTVTLSEPVDQTVRFAYATRDSTPVSAIANEDYVVIPRFWRIGRRINPGETQTQLRMTIHNDSHDEDPETFEVELFDAFMYRAGIKVPVTIADAVAVGTIVNDDPMPAAWLSRFGRTAAEQALDSITGRIAASRSAGAQGAIAGQALILDSDSKLPTHEFGSDVARAFSNGSTKLSDDGFGTITFDPEAVPNPAFSTVDRAPQTYSMTAQELLLGSSFTATEDSDSSGGSLAFWGHMTQSSFDGQEGTFSLDAKTTTAMVGTDYARGELLLGMALMYSKGDGGYADTDTDIDLRPESKTCPNGEKGLVPCGEAMREGDGQVEASLTSVVPYGALQASEHLKVWGAFGQGTGEVTLKPQVGGSLSSDISWTMAAGGLRGDLIAPSTDGNGFALAVTADALWARTTSDQTHELAASDSDITRLRLGLEGIWHMALVDDGSITPKFELGLRQDGGDAETGFGIELGGSLTWMDPTLGMSLDLSGRTLITHDSDDLKDRGFSASLAWDPKPSTARGPSVRMNWDWGGQATGGLDSLFTPQTLDRRTGTDAPSARWRAEAAYGWPVLGGRFIGSPHMGLGLATGSRDYSLGWRVTPQSSAPDLSFGVSAMRTESDSFAPEHAVRFEAIFRW